MTDGQNKNIAYNPLKFLGLGERFFFLFMSHEIKW